MHSRLFDTRRAGVRHDVRNVEIRLSFWVKNQHCPRWIMFTRKTWV